MTKGPTRPLIGPGRFQWHAMAWFGSTIGCAIWMPVVSGALLSEGQTIVALLPAFAFVMLLAIICLLWTRRDRIPPYRAMMIALTFLAIAFPVVGSIILIEASSEVRSKLRLPDTVWPTILLLSAIVPALMLLFARAERTAMRS